MNAYKILGIDPKSTEEEVRKAYRDKAKDLHPDKGGSEEAMKELNVAKDILLDSNKRFQHDMENGYRENSFQGLPFDPFELINFNMGFMDILDMVTGRGHHEMSTTPELQVTVEIPLDKFLRGEKHNIKYYREDKCLDCNGTGSSNKTIEKCAYCNGKGYLSVTNRVFAMTCSHCSGLGIDTKNICSSCKGEGVVAKLNFLSLNLSSYTSGFLTDIIPEQGSWSLKEQRYGNLNVVFQITQVNGFSIKVTPYRKMVIDGSVRVNLKDVINGEVQVDLILGKTVLKVIDNDEVLKNIVETHINGWDYRITVKYIANDK